MQMSSEGFRSRRSIRLREYDYAIAGCYFVTICARGRLPLFGDWINGSVNLNALGRVVDVCWNEIAAHFPRVTLDLYVIMPNHVHGIVVIRDDAEGPRGTPGDDPRDCGVPFAPVIHEGNTREAFRRPVTGSLPTIIRSFKSAVTKRRREAQLGGEDSVWQRGYYEHVIRSPRSLEEIRRYIVENPARWPEDPENPVEVRI